jgi:hypothetical protein
MKRHYSLSSLICILLIVPLNPALAQQGFYQLGEVIGLRYATLTSGDADAYEQFTIESNYPFWDANMPGANLVTMKSDRGTREGMYAWFFNFDTVDRWDYYFPQPAAPWPNFDAIYAKFNEDVGTGGFETDVTGMGDYVLVGRETVEGMPRIEMLGIHHVQVQEARGPAFEEFVTNKWNPHAHVPGMWMLVYKADRGARVGEYISVIALEPGLLRDIYFPEGEGNSEAALEAMQPILYLYAEMQTYLVPNTEREVEWSDFFVIR